MISIDDYCDMAKKIADIKTDSELARRLGITHAAISGWRTKRIWPSENVMIKLADLAHMNPEIALIHLETWRTSGRAQELFVSIANKLSELKPASAVKGVSNASNHY